MTNDPAVIAAQLDQAKADLARWQTLCAAEELVKKLQRDYDKAKAAHERQAEADRRAAQEARFALLSNVSVTEISPANGMDDNNLFNRRWRIGWTKPVFNCMINENVPQRYSVNGFQAIPEDVYEFLVVKRPELVPDAIMELAPDNPHEAFREYFMGRRRGYFIRKVAA
jgi:hypothetical protein